MLVNSFVMWLRDVEARFDSICDVASFCFCIKGPPSCLLVVVPSAYSSAKQQVSLAVV